jgi:hypothetical protein
VEREGEGAESGGETACKARALFRVGGLFRCPTRAVVRKVCMLQSKNREHGADRASAQK